MSDAQPKRVAIVGGGLAGMAAAVAAVERGFQVELFERTRHLGGRAGAFFDPQIDQWVDVCQHVTMGCCTNLADFYRRIGVDDCLEPLGPLHFVDSRGKSHSFRASRWLPAPLHLGPALFGLAYLSLADRLRIARGILRLVALRRDELQGEPTIGDWLGRQGQSEAAIRRFWSVVLVGALGESIDVASLSAAAQVFRDGFFAARDAHVVSIPNVSLYELHHQRCLAALKQRGVTVHLGANVRAVEPLGPPLSVRTRHPGRLWIESSAMPERAFDAVIVAAPWHDVTRLLGTFAASRNAPPAWKTLIRNAYSLVHSPIAAVHLWFDRPVTRLQHAVLVDRSGDWMFRSREPSAGGDRHHVQIVTSAARRLERMSPTRIVHKTLCDLYGLWPDVLHPGSLVHWKVTRSARAVFSMRPGVEQLRPGAVTPLANLFLAGDWTATSWPATMEGAVRSGYRAVEALCHWADGGATTDRSIVVPDLASSRLSSRLLRRRGA